ncbi:MAG: hypothetical protein J0H15_13420 [Xanthomonadales bacterium]|nr:hypothetical protein [Xanthomonadales bacterium]
MTPLIESGLAFLLFLPLFAILGALYWILPRQPRTRARRLGDAAVLIGAAVLSYAAVRWGFANASRAGGQIWAQVLAALLAYGMFVLCLVVAAFVRAWLLRRPPG